MPNLAGPEACHAADETTVARLTPNVHPHLALTRGGRRTEHRALSHDSRSGWLGTQPSSSTADWLVVELSDGVFSGYGEVTSGRGRQA